MDLPDRRAQEAEIQSALAELSDAERTLILAHIGDPPDPRKIPESVWAQIERDRRAALLIILLGVWLDSARLHGLTGEYAETLGYQWASERARWVAGRYVQTSRDRLDAMADDWIGTDGASLDGAIEERVFGATRDELMATTETTASWTAGSSAAVETLYGLSGEDMWDGYDDACDTCLDLIGTTRDEWGVEYPNGPEDSHPGCRCWILYAHEFAPVGKRFWPQRFAKYSPDQERDDHGRFGEGGGGSSSDPKEKPLCERCARAKAAYNPSTKEKQDKSEALEHKVTRAMGGKKSGDNRPMDVTMKVKGKEVGLEVKMLHDAKEQRVNMRRDSRERKEAWIKDNKTTAWTIAYDNRDKFQDGAHKDKYSGNHVYVKQGVGAFGLSTMTRCSSLAEAKSIIERDSFRKKSHELQRQLG